MHRTVTRLLGLSGPEQMVEGTVARSPAGLTVVDHATSRRRTSAGTHLAVTVEIRNGGAEAKPPVPVRVTFHQTRWLGLREESLEPVTRATDPLEPGETTTVDVGWSAAEEVSSYEVAVGSEQ